ncbi:MAG: hypothetical protein R2729_24990 [Bryobacteraceae bacterium]
MARSVAVFLAVSAACAASVAENGTFSKRFPVSGAPEVVVSVVEGDIRVTTHSGSEVIVEAKYRYEAEDAASLERLKKQLAFDAEQSGNNVWAGLDGPRDGGWRREREFGWRGKNREKTRADRGWKFRHDVEVKAPREAHLKLSTVNRGTITVDGVRGEFSLSNVNGGIEARGLDGFGKLNTVNGPITASFARNPAQACSVRTVSGKVELSFQKDLNADFKLKTLNGKLYSDFPMTAGVAEKASAESKGMKRIYRAGGANGGRVGRGGVEIDIHGVNGEVRILEAR